MASHPAILTPAAPNGAPTLDMKLHPYAAWDLAMKIAREGDTSWQARVVDMRDGTVWA